MNVFILFLMASMLAALGWRRWPQLGMRVIALGLCVCAAVAYYFFNKL